MDSKEQVAIETHWRTLAVTVILGLLSWQGIRFVEGQGKVIMELNALNVSMAEVKVRLINVNSLITETKKIEHRLTILEERVRKHEKGDL